MNCGQWASNPVSSVYADYGTLAHAVAAAKLNNDELDTNSLLGLSLDAEGDWCEPFADGALPVQVDIDMLAIVDTYLEHVATFFQQNRVRLVEARVPIGHLTGEEGATGTADVVGLPLEDDGELVVIDLKTGRGVEVSAESNPQLMMYALGALEMANEAGVTVSRVRLVISQPRISSVPSEWDCSVAELEAFAIAVRAAAEQHGNTDATPGEAQCRWCARKATCAALAGRVQADIGAQFEDLTTADKGKQDELVKQLVADAYLPAALDAVGLIEDWCAAVRAEAERRLHNGVPVPGYKLVAGKRGKRAWSDAKAAEELLRKRFRLTVEQAYDLTLISPTAAEKVLKDSPKRWEQLLPLISQSEGKPTVAPIHDKRPAIELKPVAEQFNDETGADLA